MAKSALGRGLGALLGGAPAGLSSPAPAPGPVSSGAPPTEPVAGERVYSVALSRIHPSPLQPRKDFSPESLRELADSIREQGILQPLVVRPHGKDFELIAGERRWRAAQLLAVSEVPVLVREADDTAVLELMLIENLQRENLNPIEEAQGFAQLIEQFHLRQEDAAQKVGKSRAVVANTLRLLKLPEALQAWVREGRLSVGHAKVILGLNLPAEQQLAGERVLRDGLNVRQTEELVARMQKRGAPNDTAKMGGTSTPLARDVHVADLEKRLQERLGTKVQLRYRQGKGSVEVRFFSDDDLERLLVIFGVKMD